MAVQAEQELDESLFKREGLPPVGSLVPMSLQHVLASFAGVITPAMMIATTCGFTQEQETAIIQVALILSAIDTLLQQFPLFSRIGAGLPILTVLLGAELVGGIVAILFGIFYSKVRRLFPPLVTGTVIFTIGVSLYPTAIRYMAGGAGSANFGGIYNWIVGLITAAVVFALATLARACSSSARSSLASSLAALLPSRLAWSTAQRCSALGGSPCRDSCRMASSSTRLPASRSAWST